MLQQTQVERVVPYYRSFLKRFPTMVRLAEAPLSDVLRAWQGLGYNRRAKLLHEAAKTVVRERKGRLPRSSSELERLPGIGPYTARAVAAFAYNDDTVFVETNLRTAVIHHFFPGEEKVPDTAILAVLARVLPKGKARAWYGALMDYGAHLKRSGVRLNARSASYARQTAFKGSDREARGVILKALLDGTRSSQELVRLLGREREAQMRRALLTLARDGMIRRSGRGYQLGAESQV